MKIHIERGGTGYAVALTGWLLSLVACRPALTIGWLEILVIFGLGILVGAPLWLRLYRHMAKDRLENKGRREEES